MSIWGSDVTLAADKRLGAPHTDFMDAEGRYYAAGDAVAGTERGGWLDVATTDRRVCELVRLIVSLDGAFAEVFLDVEQVRAIRDRLSAWLGEAS